MSRRDLLRLAYADASPLAAGVWRLSIGFALTDRRGGTVPPIPREALRIRPADDLRRAQLRVTRTAWAIPGRILEADVALHGASTSASTYLLRIDCPEIVDPAASSARFAAPDPPGADDPIAPPIDFLTKDYVGFRQLMLNAINRVLPAWHDDSEADLGVTVVESLAYAADFLSYHQDAVATEAYLDTARQRTSIRRHLRLLGYRLGEGCAGRLLVRLTVRSGGAVEVPAGTVYIAAPELPLVLAADDQDAAVAVADGRPVYTQIEDALMRPELNRVHLLSPPMLGTGWGRFPVLAPATGDFETWALGRIFGVSGTRTAEAGPVMHPFRVVGIEPTRVRADDGRRLTILVSDPADALPWSLDVGDEAVLTGNLVLAEFGRMVREELPMPVAGRPYCPTLEQSFVVPVVPVASGDSAADLLSPEPDRAVAAVTLRETDPSGSGAGGPEAVWHPAADLLESSGRARRFVVETNDAGVAILRFGDAVFGRRPSEGVRLVASYRVGLLAGAVVGEGRLDTLVAPSRHAADALRSGILDVRNTVPSKAQAFREPEDRAIMRGKAGFRVVHTCITLDDIVAAARAVPGVAEAVATLGRAGSAEAIVVRVRSGTDLFVAETLLRRVREAVEERMLPGRRLAVRGPRFARLSLSLAIRLERGFEPSEVRRAIDAALSTRHGSLFAPDALAFGRPVFASRIAEIAGDVPGVAVARVTRLARAGDADAPVPVLIALAPDEIPVVAQLAVDMGEP